MDLSFDWHWLETMISAAAGASLTWVATRSERTSLRKHEERRLRRDKAEQTFLEISKMEQSATAMMTWAFQKRAQMEAVQPLGFDDAPLFALLSLYFQDGLPTMERRSTTSVAVVTKIMNEASESQKKNDNRKMLNAPVLIALELSETATTAAKELRAIVRGSVNAAPKQ